MLPVIESGVADAPESPAPAPQMQRERLSPTTYLRLTLGIFAVALIARLLYGRVGLLPGLLLVAACAAFLVGAARALGPARAALLLLIVGGGITRYTVEVVGLSLKVEHIAALFGGAIVAVLILRRHLSPRLDLAGIMLVGWLGLNALAAILHAPNRSGSLRLVAMLALVSGAYFIATHLIRDRRAFVGMLAALIAIGAGVAAFGVLAYLIYPLGLDLGVQINPITKTPTAYGAQWEGNIFGGYCATIAIAALALRLLGGWRGGRAARLVEGALLLALLGLQVSLARGAWLAALAGIGFAAIGALILRRRLPDTPRLAPARWLVFAPLVVAFSAFLWFNPIASAARTTNAPNGTANAAPTLSGGPRASSAPSAPAIGARAQSVVNVGDPTYSQRGLSIARALRDTRTYPLIGWGTGTFGQKYINTSRQPDWLPTVSVRVLHDTGLLGVALFHALVALVGLRAVRALWRRPDPALAGPLFAALAGLVTLTLAYEVTEGLQFTVFWLLLGLVAAGARLAEGGWPVPATLQPVAAGTARVSAVPVPSRAPVTPPPIEVATTPPAPIDARWHLAALGIVLAGGAARFSRLGDRSLWLGEVLTARSLQQRTLADVLAWTRANPDQMPLLNILVWLLRGLGGGEWALRLIPALAGTLGVLAAYALGTALAHPRVGLVAAALTALLPFAVWYGQEARVYSLLMLLTTLQLLFAYRAATSRRIADFAWLAAGSVLNLYAHSTALLATAAAFGFVGLSLAVTSLPTVARALRSGEDATTQWALDRLGRDWLKVAAAAACVACAYPPWLSRSQRFLSSGDMGTGRAAPGAAITPSALGSALSGFSLTGPLVALAGVGLAAALAALAGRAWRRGLLLLCWLAIPSAALWSRMGGSFLTVNPRYLSFLFPLVVLLIALGVEALALLIGRVAARRPCAGVVQGATTATIGRVATYTLVGALFLVQIPPGQWQAYPAIKEDYRGAIEQIVASGPPGSVVFALGDCSASVNEGLGYYSRQRAASLAVFDGDRLDDRAIAMLRANTGQVWAAVSANCSPTTDLTLLPREGLATTSLDGLLLARPTDPSLSAFDQARLLLERASGLRPRLLASAYLLDSFSGRATLGENLLPTLAAPGWDLADGVTATPDGGVLLRPQGPMLNALYTASGLAPGPYALTFRYRNDLVGEQRVYASAHDAAGAWLDIFPHGAGYDCAASDDWRGGAFAFTLPSNAASLIIWLRATGTGTAEFAAVELHPMR